MVFRSTSTDMIRATAPATSSGVAVPARSPADISVMSDTMARTRIFSASVSSGMSWFSVIYRDIHSGSEARWRPVTSG